MSSASKTRLGERLVAEGMISESQLTDAIKWQVVRGGRIGTILVQTEALTLDQLTEILARYADLPPATKQDFDQADPALQMLLDPEIAKRLKILPLRGEGTGQNSCVLLAAEDPLSDENRKSLEEVFGREVRCKIAPELRLAHYLEQVYQVERPSRLRRSSSAEELLAAPYPGEQRNCIEPLRPIKSGVSASSTTPTGTEVDERETGKLARITVKRVAVSPAVAKAKEPPTIKQGIRKMRQAVDRDAVSNIVMETLQGVFPKQIQLATLFIVRKNLAIGWKCFVNGKENPVMDKVGIPLNEPGILNQPFHFGEPYFGDASRRCGEIDRTFWAHLGCEEPKDVAVVPIELFGDICCHFIRFWGWPIRWMHSPKGFLSLASVFAAAFAGWYMPRNADRFAE